MTSPILQPPMVAKGDRQLEAAITRAASVPVTFPVVWDPETCPEKLLPWLAWGLSIDIWDPAWPLATKRLMVAEAIERQRRKGSVRAVKEVLDVFGVGITVHEWFDPDIQGPPFTFEVRLPVVDPETAAASFIEKVLGRVVRVKPARAHFTVAQTLQTEASVGLVAVARIAGGRRIAFEEAPAVDWGGCLLTEDGEPLFTEGDARLEEES